MSGCKGQVRSAWDWLQIAAVAFAFCLPQLLAHSQNAPISSGTKPAVPVSCASRVKAAREAGLQEGAAAAATSCDANVKDAKQTSFSTGFDLGLGAATKNLGDAGGKIPITLSIEDIPGKDAYQLAAAELISTYFSQHFVISQNADLIVYITGAGSESDRTISFEISIRFYTSLPVKTGDKSAVVPGVFTICDGGAILTNYSAEKRTQAVKEKLYTLLSKADGALFKP
jgi:hypothetical protein